jgi:hypothetical protein
MASWALPLYFRDEAGFYSTVISLELTREIRIPSGGVVCHAACLMC